MSALCANKDRETGRGAGPRPKKGDTMKDYTFTLEDGRDVRVRIVGEYADRRDHDWTIEGIDGFYEEVEEDDGQRVVELIESHFTLMENQARFVSMILVDVMGHGSMTISEALDNQARFEGSAK